MSAKAEDEKKKGKAFEDKAAAGSGRRAHAVGPGVQVARRRHGRVSPKNTDTVKVNYKGTLIDGTEFDSSYKRGQPAEFPLMGVIPCWTEGLQKMKVGEKAKLVCPSNIAYGDQGRPPTIPGGATLVFEVELLGITTQGRRRRRCRGMSHAGRAAERPPDDPPLPVRSHPMPGRRRRSVAPDVRRRRTK